VLKKRKRLTSRKKNKRKKRKSSENHPHRVDFSKTLTNLKSRFFLPRFLKEMKKLKIGGISGGNSLRLITDGDTCFGEFVRAIKSAKLSINFETYIFNSDDIGWMFAELLVKKAKAGVEVNFMYDAVGCVASSPAIFNYMRAGGVEVVKYHPFIPWRKFWNISFRDHRKILVVDGRIGYLGGINIGMEYAGERYGGGNWRDSHLRIEGPAVREIQFFFMENWFRHGGAIVDSGKHFLPLREKGRKLVMVLSSSSRKNIRPIKESYLSAIKYAQQSIFITNAYFIPDAKVYRSLIRAAKRGVEVIILLPGKSDVNVVRHASRYLYKKYLKSGIRVFEYSPTVLHAKTAVIDGIWSTVGSSNIDRRSFKKNLELNAIVLDQSFGGGMEEVFFRDLEVSVEYRLENWEKRSILNYALEWLCYRFRNLM